MVDSLRLRGFALTTDEALGFDPSFRCSLQQNYFDTDKVRWHEGDRPADRERARDVVYYSWGDAELYLEEASDTSIVRYDNNGDFLRREDYSRILTLTDPELARWIGACLACVPREEVFMLGSDLEDAYILSRKYSSTTWASSVDIAGQDLLEGTMGINFFRTHTNVVGGPHHDGQKFIGIYVVGKEGTGADNMLIPEAFLERSILQDLGVSMPGEPLHTPLRPGDLLIFFDDMFEHDVTPLVGNQRDVIVFTIDWPGTYPSPYDEMLQV
jgi:hypothetical protein